MDKIKIEEIKRLFDDDAEIEEIPKELNDFLKKLNKIIAEFNSFGNTYEYAFLKKIDDKTYQIDDEYIKKYTTNRKGYEKWKDDNSDLTVGISGEISFRKVLNKNNEEVGAFLEKRIDKKKTFSKDDLNKILDEFCELMDVKDKDSVKAYLDYEIKNFINWDNSEFEAYIDLIGSIIGDYYEDEDFRNYFDKLKK